MTTTPDGPGSGSRPPAADVGPLAGVPGPLPPDPAATSLLDPTPTTAFDPQSPVTVAPAPVAPSPVAPSPVAPSPVAPSRPAAGRRTPRIRTLVFGLVMLVVAGTVMVATLADLRVDGGALLLVVLVVAGVALLGGGIAAAAKEARGGPGA